MDLEIGALARSYFFLNKLTSPRKSGQGSALHRDWMEDTMFDAGRRPIGRLFYWLVTVMMITGSGLRARAVP